MKRLPELSRPMRPQTRHAMHLWIAASYAGKAYADLRLAQLRKRSPITAPTSKEWRAMNRIIDILAHPYSVVTGLVLLGLGIFLVATYA